MREPMRVRMDNVTYRVCIVADSYADSFELVEGINAGPMLNDQQEYDLTGAAATYSMTVARDPRYPLDHIAFYEALREPVDSHEITVLDGQGELTYQAHVRSGARTYEKTVNGVRLYSPIEVIFEPVAPQWEVSDA